MFSRRACTRRRTAHPSDEDESARCPFSPTERSGSSTGAFLESSGAPALRSTESIPYAGHRSYIDLTNAGSARDLSWIMGANPIAPCPRVTRAVEIPTTFAPGSDRRHWLKTHETTTKDAPPHQRASRGRRGPAHYSRNGRGPRPPSRELETTPGPASAPAANARRRAAAKRRGGRRWLATAPAGPWERAGEPGQHDHSASALPR